MPNALESKAAQLVAAFEQRLDQDKRDLITNAMFGMDGFSEHGFEPIRFIAHRIVGSARLFGCDALSEPAKKLEVLVEQGADVGCIIQAVNELIEHIDNTLADGVPFPAWVTSSED